MRHTTGDHAHRGHAATGKGKGKGKEAWLAATWPFVRDQLPPPPAGVIELGCGLLGGPAPTLLRPGYHAIGAVPKAPGGPEAPGRPPPGPASRTRPALARRTRPQPAPDRLPRYRRRSRGSGGARSTRDALAVPPYRVRGLPAR